MIENGGKNSILSKTYEIQLWLLRGGVQNLERRNVERPIFRIFKIANIKITKVDLFDNSIFEFIFEFKQVVRLIF